VPDACEALQNPRNRGSKLPKELARLVLLSAPGFSFPRREPVKWSSFSSRFRLLIGAKKKQSIEKAALLLIEQLEVRACPGNLLGNNGDSALLFLSLDPMGALRLPEGNGAPGVGSCRRATPASRKISGFSRLRMNLGLPTSAPWMILPHTPTAVAARARRSLLPLPRRHGQLVALTPIHSTMASTVRSLTIPSMPGSARRTAAEEAAAGTRQTGTPEEERLVPMLR
jgi:hypothetical protein